MKYSFLLILTFLLSCSDDEQVKIGCLTGVPKGEKERILIKCSTRDQFLAGSNTSAGGTNLWTYYTAHKWEECDCK